MIQIIQVSSFLSVLPTPRETSWFKNDQTLAVSGGDTSSSSTTGSASPVPSSFDCLEGGSYPGTLTLFHLEKLLRIILLYGFSFHNSDIKHKLFLVISLLVSHPDSIPPSGDMPNHGPPYNNYGYPGMQPAYQQGPAPYVDSSPSHDLYGKQQPQQYAQVSQQPTRVLEKCLEEAWDNTTLHHSKGCWMADWCSLLFVIYIWHILHFLVYKGDEPI